jgi:hypothetical protein
MGQYGNQPDFGTIVKQVTINNVVPPSAIFIGELNEGFTTCSIEVLPVGNEDTVLLTGLTSGTFLPIVVTKVVSVTGITEGNVLLYR